MPSKSRKAASRQAQLRKRRQRGKARTQTFDPGPSESTSGAEAARELPATNEAAVENGAVSGAATVDATRPEQPPVVERRQPPLQAPAASPMTYPYLVPEIRHIGVVSSLIVILLVVLTIVLRS